MAIRRHECTKSLRPLIPALLKVREYFIIPTLAWPAPKKLIHEDHLAPGDILMLTAAVRELNLGHPGRFVTDVRTPYPDFWLCSSCVTLASTVAFARTLGREAATS